MGKAKWIGGFLGFVAGGGVLGALAGFAVGSVIDGLFEAGREQAATGAGGAQSGATGMRNERDGFLFSLMVLSAHIIQADGKIMHSEMEHVRRFLRTNFGEGAVEQGNQILHKLFEYRKQNGEQFWNTQIDRACYEMAISMPYGHRMQLIVYLAELVKADGVVRDIEVQALRRIAVPLRLDASIVDQMFATGGSTIEDAYRVLGVSPQATDEEIRKAYKKLVIEYHPDKVATLGDDVKEAATRKIQEINEAKERIYKARGMN